MKARIPMLGAAALLSIATFAAPASAQRYHHDYYNNNYRHGDNYRDYNYRDYRNYGRTTIRCDGDRCATWGCDRNGWHCRRISGYFSRASAHRRDRYDHPNRYDRDDRYDRDRDRDRDWDPDRR